MIVIMQNLPNRAKYKTVRTPKEEQLSLEQKCSESNHDIISLGDRINCRRCRESFLVKDPAFQPWLAGICHPVPSTDRPMPIQGLIHVGNQYTHYTHRLKIHRGLVYCAKCGSRATEQMRLLSRKCRPPRKYGKDTLRAINADCLPPGLVEWPE